ncbi:glycosyltransferase [Agrococcus sp. SL85]|uniref:glycosyltransferase family 2 protein n=1 Tax=Agrococcus sp. SL85 TaxID=2995141 RepID=UPI00226C8B76|nr:glycosyltransferase [Agrococcus sp. SL85]WAC65570.1 glycosyltransferase [Agrococcus sp. SL85]
MSAGAPAPRVVIAVPTYRRTALLPELVAAIAADAAEAPAQWRILLVDNDPEASARETAAALGVGHLHVPAPGIAAARQAALEAAEGDELVVMIDDDLVPEPGWLAGLVETWQAHRPDAVMGFVRYVWPEGTDPWVAAGGFMRRTRFPTGTPLQALSTGNVLIDPRRARELGVAFDVALGLSGGSDLDFGHRLLAAGGTIVASAESVARDDIVAARTTRAFVHRRAVCQGQVRVRIMSRDEPALGARGEARGTPRGRARARARVRRGGAARAPARRRGRERHLPAQAVVRAGQGAGRARPLRARVRPPRPCSACRSRILITACYCA